VTSEYGSKDVKIFDGSNFEYLGLLTYMLTFTMMT